MMCLQNKGRASKQLEIKQKGKSSTGSTHLLIMGVFKTNLFSTNQPMQANPQVKWQVFNVKQ